LKRPKKTLPLEKEIIAPGVELITDRKGLAQGHHISMQLDVASEEFVRSVFSSMAVEDGKGFEEAIEIDEREAIKVLEDAGLPTNFGGSHTIPTEWDVSPPNSVDKLYFDYCQEYPEFGGMALKELVKSKGYRQREDPEWYAAAIVEYLSIIRAGIRRNAMDYALRQAFRLGNLVADAKALGFFQQKGDMGPRKRKPQKSPYPVLAKYLAKNYPDETDEDRFEMVPSDEELPLGRYKFYRDEDWIYAEKEVGDDKWESAGKPIKLSAFSKYMTKERKRTSR